ncbi:MAG TPA: hypothetical protein VG866_01260 [Candidatus Paceibacterota bacterium]|nr:hypothetical protein [Candidatus Paceibacterota bacterium]
MKQFKNLAYAAVAALPDPTSPVTGQAVTLAEIQDRIQQVAQFLIVISLVIAVAFIVIGGIRYMVAGGGDTKAAKATIYNGIIGAAVVLAVGVILQTVAGFVTRSFFS